MRKVKSNNLDLFQYLSRQEPYAYAKVSGGAEYPTIHGRVEFFSLPSGVLVVADIEDLPKTSTDIFAFHIHEGTNCDNNFENTGAHFNPTGEEHPKHAGDMPPLFAYNGCAWIAFFDQRVSIKDILGKVVIIHDNPDDFTTQPSGNSGKKIACGVIQRLY